MVPVITFGWCVCLTVCMVTTNEEVNPPCDATVFTAFQRPLTLSENRPLRTFDFGKRVRLCKCL